MATEIVRDVANNIVDRSVTRVEDNGYDDFPVEPILKACDTYQPRSRSSSEATAISDFSRDVDMWIRGDIPSESGGLQGTSPSTAQHSTMVPPHSVTNGLWYMAAAVMPIISANNDVLWRCTPRTALNTAQLLVTQMSQVCSRLRSRLHRMVTDHGSADLFATAIDLVLVLYAIGFLLLSLYQAYIITH